MAGSGDESRAVLQEAVVRFRNTIKAIERTPQTGAPVLQHEIELYRQVIGAVQDKLKMTHPDRAESIEIQHESCPHCEAGLFYLAGEQKLFCATCDWRRFLSTVESAELLERWSTGLAALHPTLFHPLVNSQVVAGEKDELAPLVFVGPVGQ